MRLKLITALAAITPVVAALAITACTREPKVCTKDDVPGGCDGGTVVTGEYPDCKCVVFGEEDGDDEPIIQGPDGGGSPTPGLMTGDVRVQMAPGWKLVDLQGELSGIVMVAEGVEGTTIASGTFPVSLETTKQGWGVALSKLDSDFGYVATAKAEQHSLMMRWEGPAVLTAVSPTGRLISQKIELDRAMVPVEVFSEKGSLEMAGKMELGVARIELSIH